MPILLAEAERVAALLDASKKKTWAFANVLRGFSELRLPTGPDGALRPVRLSPAVQAACHRCGRRPSRRQLGGRFTLRCSLILKRPGMAMRHEFLAFQARFVIPDRFGPGTAATRQVSPHNNNSREPARSLLPAAGECSAPLQDSGCIAAPQRTAASCQEETCAVQQKCRGRDASYLAPPAQIRTCSFPAYGLYGAFFVKRHQRHFCRALSFHSFVRPAPRAFFRPDRIFRRRRAQRRSRTALLQRRRRLVLDRREHGGKLPGSGGLAAR
jgi:hypothetical protein